MICIHLYSYVFIYEREREKASERQKERERENERDRESGAEKDSKNKLSFDILGQLSNSMKIHDSQTDKQTDSFSVDRQIEIYTQRWIEKGEKAQLEFRPLILILHISQAINLSIYLSLI